ncbi:dynamin GTPase, partial [Aspergillus ochraceoroseus]
MVLREFHSSALDSLCTDEQLDLLNSIDTLRSQGISHYVSLPQIIVCGDQSSGKSSVLEAISGVSFPVKSNLCTRFPTELVLRKDSNVGVRVSIVPHHSRSEAEQRSLGSFCEELDGFEGLPQLIDNAKAAMGISTHGNAFSNDLLRVEVSGPDRPHLTIVDLPGLIHSETKQQSAADVQLVQGVVQSYMKEPRSIILAVISAKNDYANQIVLRLARDADKSGNRTLGVITKPDTLIANSESEKMFISLANNHDVEFRLGWHALRNMDTDQGTWTLVERDQKERDFFSKGAWGEMPSSLVGISSLRTRLSKLLLRQIAAELPSLIEEIKAKEYECIKQLKKLGQPRATLDEQKSYLLHISQHFQSLVKAAVDGTYNEVFFEGIQSSAGRQKRIRAVVQNLNEVFAERLSRGGHYRKITGQENQPDIEGQILVTRSGFINHIQELMKQTRGRELPGTFNPMIVSELFLEQCGPWEAITRQHILTTWQAAERFLSLLIGHISDEATSVVLFAELISPALDQLREVLVKRCEEILETHQKGHPITYNHYFTETLQKIRADRREGELSGIIERFFRVDDLQTSRYLDGAYRLQDLVQSLLESSEPDMMRFASAEALDCMLAYYKVALKRFIDDVAVEVVEVKLVQSLASIFTPVKVFEMPPNLVSRIAGESEETRALREQLNKKIQILGNGLGTCQRFAGSRGMGTDGIQGARRFDGKSRDRYDHTLLHIELAGPSVSNDCGSSDDE